MPAIVLKVRLLNTKAVLLDGRGCGHCAQAQARQRVHEDLGAGGLRGKSGAGADRPADAITVADPSAGRANVRRILEGVSPADIATGTLPAPVPEPA
ncbi:hypothetical protein GCM10010448_62100 [Streptomyces glomeratus]|uniref:HMA domain-containing protein n=1 Tax=Streptomyces glomeratus TaxID=284452 RepID=A0ABP6M0V2_9ACTN